MKYFYQLSFGEIGNQKTLAVQNILLLKYLKWSFLTVRGMSTVDELVPDFDGNVPVN